MFHPLNFKNNQFIMEDHEYEQPRIHKEGIFKIKN